MIRSRVKAELNRYLIKNNMIGSLANTPVERVEAKYKEIPEEEVRKIEDKVIKSFETGLANFKAKREEGTIDYTGF